MAVTPVRSCIVGPGRAGGSLAAALSSIGWPPSRMLGRDDDPADAADGVDLVVIATPDGAIAEVAARIEPSVHAVVAHMAGSLGLDVLAPHERCAALHPLVALPDVELGRQRLLDGAWCAVAGDPLVAAVVDALGGRSFEIADDDRAAYHAAAVIASNHTVALLGQAARVGAGAGVPFAALLDLVEATLDNVRALGPADALTGPAARGDDATIARHRGALPDDERATYDAMVREARRLAGRPVEPE